MTTEIAKLPEWDIYRAQTFAELVKDAAVTPGADLVNGDLLVGVPFVTTSATFRIGDYADKATKEKGAYVSVEAVTADDASFKRALARGRVKEDCTFEPGEEVVFNEGGTGVYRSVVMAWEQLGWIKLPEGAEGGAYGESRLDTPLRLWAIAKGGPVTIGEDSEGNPVYSAATRLYCKRGLRISTYENEYTKEGVTRYFA